MIPPRTLLAAALLALLAGPASGSEVTWTPIGQGGGTNYVSLGIDPNDPYRLYVAADVGGPWRSRDRGLTWELLGHKQGLHEAFHQVQDWAFSPDPVPGQPTTVLGASFKGLIRSIDGGEQWGNLTEGKFFTSCNGNPTTVDRIDERLLSIAVHPSDGDVMFVGTGAATGTAPTNQDTRIYRTIDGGDSWELVANGILVEGCSTTNFSAGANVFSLTIHPGIPSIVYASTDQGVWMSADSGHTWARIDASLPVYDACDASVPGRVNARYVDLHWNAASETTTLYVVTLSDTGGIWKAVVGTGGDPSLPSSYTWASTTDPFTVTAVDCDQLPWTPGSYGCAAAFQAVAVDPTDADVVLAVSNATAQQTMFRSTDGGDTWTRVSDDREAGWELERWEHYCPYYNFGRAWRIEFDPVDPNVVYWTAQGLYRSTNGGGNWTDITSDDVGTGKQPTCGYVAGGPLAFPCPQENRSQWAGRGSDGTWAYAIAIDPVDPGTFFIGNADNSLWRMESGNAGLLVSNEVDGLQSGQTQTLLLDPATGDLYAVHAYHSSNSKEGLWVSRSQDGGNLFTDFSEGLPGSPLCHAGKTYAQCLYDKPTVSNPCPVKTEKRARYPMVLDPSTNPATIYMARPGYLPNGVPGFGIFKGTLGASPGWVGLDPSCWNVDCSLPAPTCTQWPNPNVNSLALASGILWAGGDGFVSWSSDAGANWTTVTPKSGVLPNNAVTGRVETMAIQDQGDADPANDVIWAAVSEFISDASLMPSCGAGLCARDAKLLRISWSGSTWESEMLLDGAGFNRFDGLTQVRVVVVDAANPERLYVGATSAANKPNPVASNPNVNLPGLHFTDNASDPTAWKFESMPHVTIETIAVDPGDSRRLYVGTRGGGTVRLTFRDTDDDGKPDWTDTDDDGDGTLDGADCDPAEPCGDAACRGDEDCLCCPADCLSGVPPECGDGICEAPSEDCFGCPDDCFGVTSGPPSGRYCCGENGSCAGAGCNSGGYQCVETSLSPFCCGDATCSPQEDATSCAVDCGCTSDAQCDDTNDCTVDACVSGVCQNTPEPDSISCSGGICCGGTCGAAVCVTDADCDDQDSCSADTCLGWGTCGAVCDHSFPACGQADGCCGPSCTPATDPDCCLGPGEACTGGSECCSGTCKGNGTCK